MKKDKSIFGRKPEIWAGNPLKFQTTDGQIYRRRMSTMMILARDLRFLRDNKLFPEILRKGWKPVVPTTVQQEINESDSTKGKSYNYFIFSLIVGALVLIVLLFPPDVGPPQMFAKILAGCAVGLLASAFYYDMCWANYNPELTKDLNLLVEYFGDLHQFFQERKKVEEMVGGRLIYYAQCQVHAEAKEKDLGGVTTIELPVTASEAKKKFIDAWNLAKKFSLLSDEVLLIGWKHFYRLAESQLKEEKILSDI